MFIYLDHQNPRSGLGLKVLGPSEFMCYVGTIIENGLELAFGPSEGHGLKSPWPFLARCQSRSSLDIWLHMDLRDGGRWRVGSLVILMWPGEHWWEVGQGMDPKNAGRIDPWPPRGTNKVEGSAELRGTPPTSRERTPRITTMAFCLHCFWADWWVRSFYLFAAGELLPLSANPLFISIIEF